MRTKSQENPPSQATSMSTPSTSSVLDELTAPARMSGTKKIAEAIPHSSPVMPKKEPWPRSRFGAWGGAGGGVGNAL